MGERHGAAMITNEPDIQEELATSNSVSQARQLMANKCKVFDSIECKM
jgi:hypothetical protein